MSSISTPTTVQVPVPPAGLRSQEKFDLEDFRTIGSYNWPADVSAMSKILVPGRPAVFQKPTVDARLQKSGAPHPDENAVRHPACPLEPLFKSVALCSPEFSFHGVDVVTVEVTCAN
jgi:hypothetical protein